MIVADTNLIAYLMMEGTRTAEARAVLRADPEWAAPLPWRSEFRNVLALYMREHHLRLADARQYAHEAEALLAGHEHHVESGTVLGLAERSMCSAYDCEFVHLAQELGVPLVTSDRKLQRAFPRTAISMEGFTV